MRTKPCVTVTCEECGTQIEIECQQTKEGWKTGNVTRSLQAKNWYVESSQDFCPECAPQYRR